MDAFIKALIEAGAKAADGWVQANQALILEKAAEYETNAVDAVVAVVVNAIPKTGIFAFLGPEIAKALEAFGANLVAALGGDNQAIIAAVEAELARLAQNG